MNPESTRLVAQSIAVIAGLMLVAGVFVGALVHAWWLDRRDGRADMVSMRRREVARDRLARRRVPR